MKIQINSVDDFLEHHGIKGMKWGVRRTPEQLGYEKSRTVRVVKATKAGKKKSKSRPTKEDLKRQKMIAKREKILRSPSQLYKYRDKFTKEEIDDAMKRFRWERDLRDLSKSEINRGKDILDAAIGYADSLSKGYNTFAKAYNAFGGRDEALPIIGQEKKRR